ncbi:hypothetical protein DPEC_G00007790, partial [Dallia pectoralis]
MCTLWKSVLSCCKRTLPSVNIITMKGCPWSATMYCIVHPVAIKSPGLRCTRTHL